MGRILVVDDEESLRDALEALLVAKEHVVLTAAGVEEASQIIKREPLDLVITDLRLEPDGDGIDVIRSARGKSDPPEVILMTAHGTKDKALEAVREGAAFYVEKGPFLAKEIATISVQAIQKRQLQADNEHLRRALLDRYSTSGIIAKSEIMQEVLGVVERVAESPATVLICGESGTGKERIAKALHYGSAVRDGPFIPLNCGAMPETLIESELFGHRKGAFTGADADRQGLIESANGGTLFLDEIGELPLGLQPKLLRVLQEKRVRRVGAVDEIEVSARIVAATNRDLEIEVEAGRFREDLYYRLKVVQVDLPPLRQRQEDIPLLARTFLEECAKSHGKPVVDFAPTAMEKLLAFRFPGNVRQLQNVIERAIALSRGNTVTLMELPKEVVAAEPAPTRVFKVESADEPFPDEGVDLERLVENFEYGLISRALEKADGVKTKAAELLGLSFRQFRYKLSKYEKSRGSPKASG